MCWGSSPGRRPRDPYKLKWSLHQTLSSCSVSLRVRSAAQRGLYVLAIYDPIYGLPELSSSTLQLCTTMFCLSSLLKWTVCDDLRVIVPNKEQYLDPRQVQSGQPVAQPHPYTTAACSSILTALRMSARYSWTQAYLCGFWLPNRRCRVKDHYICTTYRNTKSFWIPHTHSVFGTSLTINSKYITTLH